jgi:tetratricopeptide (TPR) repeat protein
MPKRDILDVCCKLHFGDEAMLRHKKWIAFATLVFLALPVASALAQQVGSYVVLTQDANIYSGADPVETVTRGMALKVRGSRPGGWLWVTHHQNGWIQSKHVVPVQRALDYLAAEIAQQPRYAPFYNDRATVLFETGDYAGAVRDYTTALDIMPDSFSLRANRAVAYFEMGDFSKAVEDLNEVVRMRPEDAQSFVDRGWAKYHAHLFQEAVADYQQALQLDPNSQQAKVNLAWLRATSPDEQFRNGDEALKLAEAVCAETENKDAFALGALAAAQAELGNLTAAVENQTKAVELASYTRKKMYRQRLAFYNAGQPYRLNAAVPTGSAITVTKTPPVETKKEPQPAGEAELKPEPKPAAGTEPKSVLTPAKPAETKPAETKPAEGTPPEPTSTDQSAPQE